MNASPLRPIAVGLLALLAGVATGRAQTRPVHYAVAFRDMVVATQTVRIVHAEDETTITTDFEAVFPVFRARHRYEENLSVTFDGSGAVRQFQSVRVDNALRTEASGQYDEEKGGLVVVRTDPDGTTIHVIRREDYDFHSLILYGTAPEAFLPEHRPVRVLRIDEGKVEPYDLRSVSQTETTRERQQVASTQLTWNDGRHTSYSWHPERFDHLPSRYIRENASGRFTFTLQR